MADQASDIKVLNGLIETTLDSAEGYAEAAKEAENTRFASLFAQRASERRSLATALQGRVRELGGSPQDSGTVLASAHRVFVNLRSKLSSGDTAVIDEVERGEDHIKAKFEGALKDDGVTPGARTVIQAAYQSVKQGHDQMRDLKHAIHGQA